MQKVWFMATVGASLLTTGLFIALAWEYAVWRRRQPQRRPAGSLDRFMATSRLYGPMMVALGTFLGLRFLEGFSAGFTSWPAPGYSWASLAPILLFGAAVVTGGMLWARRAGRLRQTGEPVSDEREEAIGLQVNRVVVSVMVCYILVRGAIDYVQAQRAEPALSPMIFAATNPWIQTLLVIVLVMSLAQTYYRRRMS